MSGSTNDLVKGKTGDWEIVVGLEVHAQAITEAKLFSGAATAFGAEPNTQVSLVDAAMPGMLPVLNAHSVEQAVKTGLALNAEINLTSVFERKNYFYPDLPPGYQISQYLEPIVGNGTVLVDLPDGSIREVGIERLHLEQDAGKSLHDQHPAQTYIDLNRAGSAAVIPGAGTASSMEASTVHRPSPESSTYELSESSVGSRSSSSAIKSSSQDRITLPLRQFSAIAPRSSSKSVLAASSSKPSA